MNKRGFTILEVLVTATILSILLGGVYIAMDSGIVFQRYGKSLSLAQTEAKNALYWLLRDIRAAKGITQYADYINIVTPDGTIYYQVSDNKLLRNGKVIANNIKEVEVNVDTDLASVEVIARRSIAGGGELEYSIKGQANMRNKTVNKPYISYIIKIIRIPRIYLY